ncbi:uncharacterized protein [Lolium perenne]|uniref:uncharacterized protein n=1 Tax=Lolium perenne TaxID=4522 RepID=UPI003A99E83F
MPKHCNRGCPVCSSRGRSFVRIVAAGDRVSTPDFSITVIVLVAAVVLLRTGAGGCDCRQLCVIQHVHHMFDQAASVTVMTVAQFFRSLIAAIAGEVGKERELYGQSLFHR